MAGLVPVSVLLGNVWQTVSPCVTIARLADATRHAPPAGTGWWPAALLLVLWAWTELVYPTAARPRLIAALIVAYTLLTLGGMRASASRGGSSAARRSASTRACSRCCRRSRCATAERRGRRSRSRTRSCRSRPPTSSRHYLTLFVFQSQDLVRLASDPFGTGADLFGTADHRIDFQLVSANAIWAVQVSAIVVGHLAALALAHDRALEMSAGHRAAVRSQLPMLLLMVALTVAGLWSLSEGMAES